MQVSKRAVCVAATLAVMANARPTSAAFHLMEVEEVYFGSEDCPDAQYVMLRTTAAFQNFVANQPIATFDAGGTAAGNFGVFPMNLSNSTDGVAILMGTAEAQGLFGITFDHVTTGRLQFPDGRICFGLTTPPVDCIAYGAYTGANMGGGSPAPAPALGMALVRNGNTGNDADDFDLAPPMPQNNAGQNGTLGQCPPPIPTPTATSPAATPTATPTATTVATIHPNDYVCACDCNRDRSVLVNELVTGVNIVLESIPLDACESADVDGSGAPMVNDLVSGVNAALNGCPALGTRRFSLNGQTSLFTAVLQQFGQFPSAGFSGFLELRAGVPSVDGGAFVDVTDASEYLSILIPAQAGGEDTVLCLRPNRDRFPVERAGFVDCDGGTALGFSASQDHNIGVVGTCSGGDNAGEACTDDTGCPGGECFAAADCMPPVGIVEPSGAPHPGVCNGPIVGAALDGDSGPGAVIIASNPPFQGLPATLLMEGDLPCGDEGVQGMETTFAFTTGTSRGHVDDFNDSPGATFTFETQGTNFSCRAWSQENGVGTLVLAVPTLDLNLPLVGFTDFISVFTFDD
jgi:hypothetical protein